VSGICGVWLRDPSPRLTLSDIGSMCGALGPTGETRCLLLHEGTVGLGVQALPGYADGVLEERHGDRTLAVAFHGNLYGSPASNALLRDLLEGYVRVGIRFVETLHGEFAFALWDSELQRLFLVTDRFRVHPLLYGEGAQDRSRSFVFASRMRALDRAPGPIIRTISEASLMDVVASSYIPTPNTIFREVQKIPPGHILSQGRERSTLEGYWDVDFRHRSHESEDLLAEELRQSFRKAVAVRLETDRDPERVGAFLSGGVDSSTVSGVLTEVAARPIRTFSIGFGEERFNEMSYARIAARRFGAEHHEYFVTPKDTAAALPLIVDEFDEPFGNASAVPTYFCARLAKENGVDVLYAGDGGDELFAGNERYSFQRVFEHYERLPRPFREWILRPAVYAAARAFPVGLTNRARKYVDKASLPAADRISAYDFLNVVPLRDLATPELLDILDGYDASRAVRCHYERARGDTGLDRFLYMDLKLAIADNDLYKVNRMTERAGVVVRYPFLDPGPVSVAERVPAALKMRGRKLRVFFKRAYRDFLPPEVIQKTKHGFGLPIAIWLRTDPALHALMRDLVLSERSVARGYFQRTTLERMVAEHRKDETSFYGTALWNLMVLELWHRRYRDG